MSCQGRSQHLAGVSAGRRPSGTPQGRPLSWRRLQSYSEAGEDDRQIPSEFKPPATGAKQYLHWTVSWITDPRDWQRADCRFTWKAISNYYVRRSNGDGPWSWPNGSVVTSPSD